MSHTIIRVLCFAGLAAGALVAQTARDLFLEPKADSSGKPQPQHLGLRYTVLLVDPQTRAARSIDPDHVFHAGDCVAFEFVPNHSGSLYVFNHGSSGAWQLLMPSPQMFNEAGTVKAGEIRRLPSEHCFQLDEKAGVERFVLAITERPDDVRQLRETLAKAGSPGDVIQQWQQMASRDLRLEKVDKPASADERPNTVYAVNASAADSDRLVLEIRIHHE